MTTTIFVPGGKYSISTFEVDAGALLKSILCFLAYQKGDNPAELVTASRSLSGEMLCITVYSKRIVCMAVVLPGQLHISCTTRTMQTPVPPADFLQPLSGLV